MKQLFLLIIFCAFEYFSIAQTIDGFNSALKNSKQVVFVKTPSINSIHGKTFLYERKNHRKNWKLVDSFTVTVGRSGLAKDARSNLVFDDSMPVKHEGDGKSPAGIFKLGNIFSYHSITHLHMPFVQVDTNFYCVDDAASSYYNTLIVVDTAKHDYNSFEHMKRNDSLYEYGVWVLYNRAPVTAGNGSCIFLHVWKNQDSSTSGCTAMSKENIVKLIHWLDHKKDPVLLQIVENAANK
jgi:L,D-peptidoglycan transpeptidase YkuD (ErfK/YbiS/YcfS/YnhG family)